MVTVRRHGRPFAAHTMSQFCDNLGSLYRKASLKASQYLWRRKSLRSPAKDINLAKRPCHYVDFPLVHYVYTVVLLSRVDLFYSVEAQSNCSMLSATLYCYRRIHRFCYIVVSTVVVVSVVICPELLNVLERSPGGGSGCPLRFPRKT